MRLFSDPRRQTPTVSVSDHDEERACRAAIAAGRADARILLGNLLSKQRGREREAEAAYRDAIAVGDNRALSSLGALLAKRRGRRREAEAIFRDAIVAGQSDAWNLLGVLLAGQHGRGADAEAAYRQAIAAGSAGARVNLGNLLARMPGRDDEAEQVYRAALAAGEAFAWAGLASLLSRLPGRQAEAECLLRDALARAHADREIECAALGLANLLARRGDLAGARAAQQRAVPPLAQRIATATGLPGQGESLAASRMVRFMAAVLRRPLVARLVAARHSLRHRARGLTTAVARRPPISRKV